MLYKFPFRFTATWALVCFSLISLWGQGMQDPVAWTMESRPLEGDRYLLTFEATIAEGWTVYSQFLDIPEGEVGPNPTALFFTDGSHYELVGDALESGDPLKVDYDPVFEMELGKFFNRAVLKQEVRVTDPSQPVEGYLEYMTCNDRSCLPPTAVDFSFQLAGEAASAAEAVPNDLPAVDQSVPTIQATYQDPLGNCGTDEGKIESTNPGWTFLLGFAGGLLALLTPCVFPMIPLTVSFFTKRSANNATGIRNALLFGLSIIIIYVSIGLLVTAVFGATALNELSTNWIANTLFFVIFVLFALSFFGLFEITLPSAWANKADAYSSRGGFLGIFFMAFTLAIVSFSCTGPIIGQSLVLAATSSLGPFLVMLGFSTALALPFGLFAAFPAWLNSLPRSGSWMNSVKVILGFVELALALKFLSVADMTMHWGILPYEVFLGAWTLIALAMGLYLLGFIRFPHEGPVSRRQPLRVALGLGSLALGLYFASGFMLSEKTGTYDSLGLLSGLAPPAQYNLLLPEPDLNPALKEQYASYGKCANNLDCFKDYEEGIAYARSVNKPVLLDFTGYGCVNCRKTEEHIWIEDGVWGKIQEDYVLVSLYVDDRASLEQDLISAQRGTRLRNVGNKWADFQIVNFQQNSQPLYVLLTPEEEVLAPPRGYRESVEGYADFLSCGLYTYQRIQEESPAPDLSFSEDSRTIE